VSFRKARLLKGRKAQLLTDKLKPTLSKSWAFALCLTQKFVFLKTPKSPTFNKRQIKTNSFKKLGFCTLLVKIICVFETPKSPTFSN